MNPCLVTWSYSCTRTMGPQRCFRSTRQLSRSVYAKSANPIRPPRSVDQSTRNRSRSLYADLVSTGPLFVRKSQTTSHHLVPASDVPATILRTASASLWPHSLLNALDRTGILHPHPLDGGQGPVTLTAVSDDPPPHDTDVCFDRSQRGAITAAPLVSRTH